VKALLFCVDGPAMSARRLEPILQAFPRRDLRARLRPVHLMELAKVDIRYTVREMFESAVAMGREALSLFCVDEDEVKRVECEYRTRDQERLVSQAASGDLHASARRCSVLRILWRTARQSLDDVLDGLFVREAAAVDDDVASA